MLLEKLILTGLLVFAGRGTIFQCVGACFVAVVFLFLHARTWPYEGRNNNVLRAFAESQLFVMLLISIALRADIGKDILSDDGYGAILVVNLFMAPSVWAIMIVWQIFQSCKAKIRATRAASAIEMEKEALTPAPEVPEPEPDTVLPAPSTDNTTGSKKTAMPTVQP